MLSFTSDVIMPRPRDSRNRWLARVGHAGHDSTRSVGAFGTWSRPWKEVSGD
jgi:hypothetical protein